MTTFPELVKHSELNIIQTSYQVCVCIFFFFFDQIGNLTAHVEHEASVHSNEYLGDCI